MGKAKEAVPILEATPSYQEVWQLVDSMARKPANRLKNEARHILLERLADVYQQATGGKPDKPYYTPYGTSSYAGKFLLFVEACIKPVDRAALNGLGDAIRSHKFLNFEKRKGQNSLKNR